MRTNLIIGAGQMGSRHLQGLLKYPEEQKIYLLDPSSSSLEMAKQRSQEIEHNHLLSFINNWQDLPESFDLVIISTNSDVREQVVSRLVNNYKVEFMVLEKVLFQETDAYGRIEDLLNKYQVATWVNHSRRMMNSYKQIKSLLKSGSKKIMQFTGGNWGLGCNSLHLIDLFIHLTDSDLRSLNTEGVDNELISSRRNGYIEFTGTLTGRLDNDSIFQLTSLKGEVTPGTITIFDPETRIIIQELGTPQIFSLQQEKMFKADLFPFELELQSSLTKRLAEELFESGDCDLTQYKQAFKTHEIFIREMLKKYNEITGKKHTKLPVT